MSNHNLIYLLMLHNVVSALTTSASELGQIGPGSSGDPEIERLSPASVCWSKQKSMLQFHWYAKWQL